VQIHGEDAEAMAKAINVVYHERKVEVKLHKDVLYIRLTNVDLGLLGAK